MKFYASDLNEIVASLAPPDLSCSWDNVGFQIGKRHRIIRRVLCALEVTPPIIKEAGKRKVQALVVHHPLIFRPASSITDATPSGRMILELIRSDLCLIVAHTNLDKSPYGTNRALAKLLGLKNLSFLEPESHPDYGMGYLGNLTREISLKSFVNSLKRKLNITHARVVGDPGTRVKNVAVVTGAGGDALRNPEISRADVLVTGEIGHHAALDARITGPAVVCAGHFATEVVGMSYFAEVLARREKIRKAGVEIMVAGEQFPPFETF